MLTQLQRDAMSRAQAGDWSLADAIELLAEGRSSFHDEPLLGGITQGGRLRMFAYGKGSACSECEGSGVVVCGACGHEDECDECDGAGSNIRRGTNLSGVDWTYIVDLNGTVVCDANAPDSSDTPPLEITLTKAWANEIVQSYNESRTQSPGTEEAIAA